MLSRFGYRDETLTTIDAACELDRKSLELRFQQAELRRKWKQFESAMSALAEAAVLTDTPETFDRVVQVEVKVLSESELLTGRIEELQAELAKAPSTSPLPLGEGGRRPGEGPSGQTTPERGATKPKQPSDDKPEKDDKRSETLTPAHPQRESENFGTDTRCALLPTGEVPRSLRQAARGTVAAQSRRTRPRNGLFIQAAARMLALDSQWLSAVELYERLLQIDRRFRIDSLANCGTRTEARSQREGVEGGPGTARGGSGESGECRVCRRGLFAIRTER